MTNAKYKNSECERCKNKTTVMTMSRFNTQMLCKDCLKKEQEHPMYEEAYERERNECLKGNYNYEGIGLPEDLK